MHTRLGIVAGAALMTLTACGGGASGTPAPTATVTVTAAPSTVPASPTPTPTPISEMNAAAIARILKQQVKGVRRLTVINEDNDANNLIGRPGGYTSAAVLTDKQGDTSDSEPGVAWGATVEVFPSHADAQRRKDYIQGILTSSPMLGTEYDYVADGALLRVTGKLKPSRAKEYETAFRAIPTD